MIRHPANRWAAYGAGDPAPHHSQRITHDRPPAATVPALLPPSRFPTYASIMTANAQATTDNWHQSQVLDALPEMTTLTCRKAQHMDGAVGAVLASQPDVREAARSRVARFM